MSKTYCILSFFFFMTLGVFVKANESIDIDVLNAQYYNSSGNAFDRIPCSSFLTKLLLKHKIEGKVLEIGSGLGSLAIWLEEIGCEVTCIEPAKEFAEKARNKGLHVQQLTLQQYEMSEMFDSIIAISSLIHIPKKELPEQLKKIASGLKEGGKFVITLMEGESEQLEDPTKAGKLRFFSRLKEEEIDLLFSPHFKLVESHRVYLDKMDRFFFLQVYSK